MGALATNTKNPLREQGNGKRQFHQLTHLEDAESSDSEENSPVTDYNYRIKWIYFADFRFDWFNSPVGYGRRN